ncbi:hypothetical protein CEP52_006895 [Fusarium oligoseptatum]|uniref:DUF7580 domain-containing protein n=1 Tax=Fusarium oligoseptatum TaxID=2604345 RepID=A0A428TQF5_9HYPO|nr:hypothetical protein CEP52_006895 [Fusarium oligoseptatum]
MSGFEIAGIVLAGVPLLLEAFKGWEEIGKRWKLWAHIKKEFDSYRADIEFYDVALTDNLRELLFPILQDEAKVNELTANRELLFLILQDEDKVTELMADRELLFSILQDEAKVNELMANPEDKDQSFSALENSLKDRLRGRYKIYRSTVKSLCNTLEDFREELNMDIKSPANKDSMSRWCKWSPRILRYGSNTILRHFKSIIQHQYRVYAPRLGTLQRQATKPSAGISAMMAVDTFYIYTTSQSISDSLTAVPFSCILQDSTMPNMRQRYSLAFTIASSVLQLLESPWLPNFHSRSEILFFLRSKPASPTCPHISRGFGSREQDRICVSDSLVLLGIVLLELFFGEPISSKDFRKKFPPGDKRQELLFDQAVGIQWLDELKDNAAPLEYKDAVKWCLMEHKPLSEEPEAWRREMAIRVVQNLEKCEDWLNRG